MSSERRNLAPFVILAVVLYVGATGWLFREYYIDDAYIGFRYARNLLLGRGLVFNPGERVEGVTNIGWTLLLALVGGFVPIPVAAKVLGALFVAATAVLLLPIGRRRRPGAIDPLFLYPLPFLAVTHFDYLYFSLAGMETALLSLVLGTMVLLSLRGRAGSWEAIAFLSAAGSLLHPEILMVYPLAVAVLFLGPGRRGPPQGRPAAIFAATLAAITLARWSYFGQLVPNTFYAKPRPLAALTASAWDTLRGTNENLAFPFALPWVLIPLFWGTVTGWRRAPASTALLVSITGAGVGFATYAEEDWTEMARYFAPYVPVAMMLLWEGVVDLHRTLLAGSTGPRGAGLLSGLYLAIMAIVAFGDLRDHTSLEFTETFPGYVVTTDNLVGPARWMDEHLPPEAVIATRRIGAVGYFTDRVIFDYVNGLTDVRVAQLVRERGNQIDYPNDPALERRWSEVHPDYLLEDIDLIELFAERAEGTISRFEVHGDDYGVDRTFKVGREKVWTLCRRLD